MDLFLAILGALLVILALLGAILPVLPGPPLAWTGLLLLHYTEYAHFSSTFLVAMFVIMAAITIVDYLLPIWGTKYFGGTKAGVRGAIAGLVLGIIFGGPWGIVLGPFAGAFLAEIGISRTGTKAALKSATGTFIGFMLGTGAKLIYGIVAVWYFVAALF